MSSHSSQRLSSSSSVGTSQSALHNSGRNNNFHPVYNNASDGNRINRSVGGFNASERHSLHPYLHNLNLNLNHGHPNNIGGKPYMIHESQDLLSQPQGFTSAAIHTLRMQGQRFIDMLVGRQHPQQQDTNTDTTKTIESIPPAVSRLILILPILYIILRLFCSSILDSISLPQFQWNALPTLDDRKCVLNLFVEKQKPDEFNPDYVTPPPPPKFEKGQLIETLKKKTQSGRRLESVIPPSVDGTYRTKGQTKVIKRFISSVADSFRPNVEMQQHLLFTGTRDGGHLAETALEYWPPRGNFSTQVYVLADDVSDVGLKRKEDAMSMKNRRRQLQTMDAKEMEDLALGYGPLGDIEDRFQNHAKASSIHIYDSKGQVAGLIPSDMDDDDVISMKEEEMFGGEDVDDDIFAHLPPDEIDDDFVLSSGGTNYVSLKKLLAPHLERDETGETMSETQHVIPYFHVDGIDAVRQFDILASAKPLLLDNTIISIVVEHSPNMDMYKLMDFFNSVHYKTFFLGMRQIARIDHMCPEIMEQIINHPFITPDHSPSIMRKIWQFLGFVLPDQEKYVHPHKENELMYPPFFVAFPRGRVMQEEMTIQHMYDLFGGMSAGGTIKTANDRE